MKRVGDGEERGREEYITGVHWMGTGRLNEVNSIHDKQTDYRLLNTINVIYSMKE